MPITILTSSADALAHVLPASETHLVIRERFVFPDGARPILPAIPGEEAAFLVTSAEVKIEDFGVEDDDTLDVNVVIYGNKLTKALVPSKSAAYGSCYIGTDPIRWDFAVALKREALARHCLEERKVGWRGDGLETHAEMVARKRAEYDEWKAEEVAKAEKILAERNAALETDQPLG